MKLIRIRQYQIAPRSWTKEYLQDMNIKTKYKKLRYNIRISTPADQYIEARSFK